MMKYVVLSVVALSLLAAVSGRVAHVNEEKCELKPQYKKLQEAFEGYTQYNNLGHTGTLLNHEVWVSNVVLDFFSKKDALGFPLKSDAVTFTPDDQTFVAQCGFMHDVGKAIPSDSPIKGIYRAFSASEPAENYYASANTPLPGNTKTEVAPPCGKPGVPCEPRDFWNADRHNGVGYKIMLGLKKMPSAAAGGAPKPISELMTALGWSKEKQAICAIATFMHYWVADTTKNLVTFPLPVSTIAKKEDYMPKVNEMWSSLRKAINSAVDPASQTSSGGAGGAAGALAAGGSAGSGGGSSGAGGAGAGSGSKSSLVELAEGPVKQPQQSLKKQTQGTLTPKATASKSSQSGTGSTSSTSSTSSTGSSSASASASTSTSEGFEPMWKDLVSVTKQKLGVVDLQWPDKKVLMAALIIAVADGVGMVYSPSGPNSMAKEGSCLDISNACQAATPIYSPKQCQLVKDQRSVWHSADAANFKLICDHLKENMGSYGELIKCDFPVPPKSPATDPNEPKCSAC